MLFRLAEKRILSEEEAKILNALFEKDQQNALELQKRTWLESLEVAQALKSLQKKNVVKENNGLFSSDFFEAAEELLKERQEILARA